MALEFSEIATLGCMFFKKKDMTDAVKDLDSLVSFTRKVRDKVGSDRFVKFGTGKDAFIRAMDPEDSSVQNDMVRACSAAIAIKDWLHIHHGEPSDVIVKKGYMTGNVWPSPVDKFRIKAFGMDDYNSSDLIVYTGKQGEFEYYYGISLKKKNKVADADPTLINKAFDSVMDGREFDKLKNDIRDLRIKWFADKVREADKKRLIKIEAAHEKLSDLELLAAKPGGTTKQYVNLKGTVSEGYDTGNGFRTWMNRQVGIGNLYTEMVKLVEPHMEMFADSLVNLVLKAQLSDELNANKNLNKYYFGFCLATGIGYVRRGVPDMGPGAVYAQESVLCGLNHLSHAKKPYKLTQIPNPAGDESTAAKVFFEISKGKIPLLKLEIRYKGDFRPQPQFQAFLTKEFKKILTGECLNP
tara:strand:+ start:3037 stop:4269 length:1233 start_codon:yes stop_codon:yes gene_type:complete